MHEIHGGVPQESPLMVSPGGKGRGLIKRKLLGHPWNTHAGPVKLGIPEIATGIHVERCVTGNFQYTHKR